MGRRVSTFQALADQDFCISERLHIKGDFPLRGLTPLTQSLNLSTEVPVNREFQIVRNCIQNNIADPPIRR